MFQLLKSTGTFVKLFKWILRTIGVSAYLSSYLPKHHVMYCIRLIRHGDRKKSYRSMHALLSILGHATASCYCYTCHHVIMFPRHSQILAKQCHLFTTHLVNLIPF